MISFLEIFNIVKDIWGFGYLKINYSVISFPSSIVKYLINWLIHLSINPANSSVSTVVHKYEISFKIWVYAKLNWFAFVIILISNNNRFSSFNRATGKCKMHSFVIKSIAGESSSWFSSKLSSIQFKIIDAVAAFNRSLFISINDLISFHIQPCKLMFCDIYINVYFNY